MQRVPKRLRSIESMEAQFAELDQRLSSPEETAQAAATKDAGTGKKSTTGVTKLRTTAPDNTKSPFLRLAVNEPRPGGPNRDRA